MENFCEIINTELNNFKKFEEIILNPNIVSSDEYKFVRNFINLPPSDELNYLLSILSVFYEQENITEYLSLLADIKRDLLELKDVFRKGCKTTSEYESLYNLALQTPFKKHITDFVHINPYYFVSNKSPRAGVVCYHSPSNSILLVKNAITNQWGVPKGRFDAKFDKSIKDTAEREFKEEVGFELPVKLKESDICYELYTLSYFYKVDMSERLKSIYKVNNKEISEVKWMNIGCIKSDMEKIEQRSCSSFVRVADKYRRNYNITVSVCLKYFFGICV